MPKRGAMSFQLGKFGTSGNVRAATNRPSPTVSSAMEVLKCSKRIPGVIVRRWIAILQIDAGIGIEVLLSVHGCIEHVDRIGDAVAVALNEIDAKSGIRTLLLEPLLRAVEPVSPLHAGLERMRAGYVGH